MGVLIREEKDRLVAAMTDAFDEAGLEQFMELKVGYRLDTITKPAPIPGMVFKVVEWADLEGKEVVLLTALRTGGPRNATLQAVLRDINIDSRRPLYYNKDPFQAHWFRVGVPFADRKTVRKALKQLHAPQGCRIVIVDGPPGSGRTYTTQFIEWLQSQLNNFSVAWVNLAEEGAVLEADDVVRKIARHIGIEMPKSDDPRPARWLSELAESLILRIVAKAEDSKRQAWIVFDGFNRPGQSPATLDLVKELSRLVAKSTPSVRLVLLGYSEPLLEEHDLTAKRARIEALCEEDLVGYFTHLETVLQLPVSSIDELVTDIMDKVSALEEPKRSKAIWRALAELTEEMLDAKAQS